MMNYIYVDDPGSFKKGDRIWFSGFSSYIYDDWREGFEVVVEVRGNIMYTRPLCWYDELLKDTFPLLMPNFKRV